MEIAHYKVVDSQGKPKSVIISWADFLIIKERLSLDQEGETSRYAPPSENNVNTEQIDEAAESLEDSVGERPDKTADHVDGGDFKPLADLGIKLPEAIQRKTVAKAESKKDEVDGIKLGKRIR